MTLAPIRVAAGFAPSPGAAVPSAAEVNEVELALLNFYRASELHGGLILGQVARRARDPYLATELLRHSAEEIAHARYWTETILAVGGRICPVRQTYQTRYAAAVGHPTGVLHVLALTQVFERRVYRHFTEHLRRPGTHRIVQATLSRMLEEEKGHLSWVRHWLEEQSAQRGQEVKDIMRRYSQVDAQIYQVISHELGWKEAA